MQPLIFESMDEQYITEIGSWFDRAKPQSDFSQAYSSAETWIKQKLSSQATLAWVVLQGREPVGFVSVEVGKDNVGQLNFAVKPASRRQGIGSQLVKHLLEINEVKKLKALETSVESDNVGGQKILVENNFVKVGYDEDGFTKFVNNLINTALQHQK